MICEKCKLDHDGYYGSGRFCSEKCCRSYASLLKREEINRKVSEKLKGKPTKGGFKFQKGYDPRRKIWSHEDRIKAVAVAKIVVRNRTLTKPFETLSKSARRWVLLEERGHKCEMCGIVEWLKIPIKLEEDHINGNKFDNRRDNIRLLCPNCHSTTPTWRGRNMGNGTMKVSDEKLIECIKTTKTLHQALIKARLTPKGGNYARANRLSLNMFEKTTNEFDKIEKSGILI